MNINIIEKTYSLAEEIKNLDIYKEVKELNSLIEKELKNELEAFVIAKEKYYEALKYGEYHPSLEKYSKDLVEKKTILYSKEIVRKYNKKYNELQKIVNEILDKIKINMSNKFETTTQKKKCGCKK